MSSCNEECTSVRIIKGEERNFFVRITDACSNNNFDLTSLTAAKAIFKGSSANVEITLLATEISIVTPATNGKLELKLSEAKTALLKTGDNQNFELELDFGTVKRIIQIKGLLNVEARI